MVARPKSLDPGDRVFVAGHRGMVGSAILTSLRASGFENLITRTRSQLDLLDQKEVQRFFSTEEIRCVILAAAKVGGIHANRTYPADFIYQNLMIEANVIHAAWDHGVDRLLFLGSSCIYPRVAEQPMDESALLAGPLESTNEAYAVAKIAGIKLCEAYSRQFGVQYRCLMPTNLYGPNDSFDLENGHVVPSLIRKFHEAKLSGAKEVEVWGTGHPRREFLHVDDLADACVFVTKLEDAVYDSVTEPMMSYLNVGTGTEITIERLAHLIGATIEYRGDIVFNPDMPDGAPRKLLDVSRLSRLGWRPRLGLEEGLRSTYQWYLDHLGENDARRASSHS